MRLPSPCYHQRLCWTLYNDWFDEHVCMVIVNKKHVPVEMMKVFDEPTTVLPPWYPGAGGVE